MKKIDSELYIPTFRRNFPLKENAHVHPASPIKSYVFDKDFPYRYKQSKHLRINNFFIKILLYLVGPIIMKFYFGLKIYNKKVFKRNKKLLSKGYITVSNHISDLDIIAHLVGRHGHYPEFPIWYEGALSKSGMMYRSAGGIPVANDYKGLYFSYKAMEQVLKENKWFHIYPEGSCFHHYVPIREFKEGTFKLAVENNKPIFPVGFSFRERKGLYKLYAKTRPLITMTYGEPIFPDLTLDKKESIKQLNKSVRDSVMNLCGIKNEEENDELKKYYSFY